MFVEATEVVDTLLERDDDPHEVGAVVLGAVRRGFESPSQD